MNKKVAITGHTRGLGQELAQMFRLLGWEVIGFSKSQGIDIENDQAYIIEKIRDCDLFVNNAYANGKQLDLLNASVGLVKNIIIIGSVAADRPDPSMPEYSENKKILQARAREFYDSEQSNILLLRLTGKSYADYYLIKRTINFWLEHKTFCEVTYKV